MNTIQNRHVALVGAFLSILLLVSPSPLSAQVYEKVYSFTDARAAEIATQSTGVVPSSALVQGSDGNFYGTTYFGGAADCGTVFKMTYGGVRTTLVEFTGSGTSNNGRFPRAGLVQGSDGYFYGTTEYGGASGKGTVFKMTAGGVLTTLVEFGASNKGANPVADLMQGIDGYFYGTTTRGGATDSGTVFKMTSGGVLTTLVEFTGIGAGNNGAQPQAGLVQGSDGSFYGTTYYGGPAGINAGASGSGTVFKMTAGGVLTTLVEFTYNGASNKGSGPRAVLIQGSDGKFYGTTEGGGATGSGTVFNMTSGGVLTTLVEFTGNGAINKGKYPSAGLVQGSDGNFYGTTWYSGTDNFGTVFKVTSGGVLTTLVKFTNNEATNKGSEPIQGLVQGSDGNFYGATSRGGADGSGTVFKMTSGGELTTLVQFTRYRASSKGSSPRAGLVQGSDGNFYGTTSLGGTSNYGTVFKMTSDGVLTTLVEFTGNGASNRGSSPLAGLVQDNEGIFYGTTDKGGASGNGTVFKMTSGGVLTTLVEFTGNGASNKGQYPRAGLVAGGGFYYGTTSEGGANDKGTVFKMTSGGVLTTLVEFTGNGAVNRGADPRAGLIHGGDGNFYGTTYSSGVYFSPDYDPWHGDLLSGTVFKMTPNGELTTLLQFTSSLPVNVGGYSVAGLVQNTDGNLYGTTSSYGGYNGTVYRIITNGTAPGTILTTLVNFTNNGAINKGSNPQAGLVQGNDGNFYGTTYRGGAANAGTVFKMTSGGNLSTLVECDSLDGYPNASIVKAADGTLYGTLSGSDGAIYRLIFPGSPLLFNREPQIQGTSSAIVQTSVNAAGSTTSVSLEYGIDSNLPPNSFTSVPIATNVSGKLTKIVGTTLAGLSLGTTYYYRFRAVSNAGTTVSPIQSFSTLAAPTAATSSASNLLATSATFNGLVNARNYPATVSFEWSADVNFSASTVVNLPLPVTDNTPKSVSAAVAGLTKGTTYYYRIIATNLGGTTVSGTQSFKTLTNPVATVGPASGITSQSAQLNGTVNALGSATDVTFEYGTNGVDFPYSFGGTPGSVNGNTPVAVNATISNSATTPLVQGVTYTYRVRATGAGGTGVSGNATFSLDILSGFQRLFPNAPAAAQGFVLVNLTPSGINSGWRFVGEQLWRTPGFAAFGLTTGNYSIEYRPVPSYIQPPPETVSIISGGAATVVNQEYFESSGGATGGLRVVLQPTALAANSVPEAQRAQWRFLGEDDTQWRDSGTTVSGLSPGNYLLECIPVSGQTTPPPSSATVSSGQTSEVKLTYFVSSPPLGAQPALLSFAEITNHATPNLPYAFVGQIRSDVGSSTGFVVRERVVATAGHVVYDDGSLSYVTGLQWLFQRFAGTYEPVPQIPRGFYLFDGYASQRDNEGTPGVSSTASQNMDVAAMYFADNAGNGGYGGYLGSDSATNEFLTSARQKMLVGYPVAGIPVANQGQMFATPPVTASFAQVPGNDSSGNPYRVYTTNAFSSVGGNSGGPLCVQFDDGTYYPAAIYLGGSAQTVVRSIDSGVIALFNLAQNSGFNGDNNTGGGISLTSVNSISSTTNGALRVTILPAAAENAGLWGVNDALTTEANIRQSGTLASGLTPGDKTLKFKKVSGFQDPTPQIVRVTAGKLKEFTFTYAQNVPAPSITSAGSVSKTRGQSLSYQIIASQSPSSYSLTGTLPSGLSFNTSTGLISGTLNQAGIFNVTLGATNATGTGSKTLMISALPGVSNQSVTVPLGQPMSRQIASSESGAGVTYSANGLPPGTSLAGTTGLITGTPTQAGVFTALCTVSKGGAIASANLTINVTGSPLDQWRFSNFGTTSNSGTAADSADPDGDGSISLEEYAAGTNPNSAADAFKILTFEKNATAFTATASGKASRSYVLERRLSLASGSWTTVVSVGPLAADGPLTLTDPASPVGQAFYRIHVSAP